MSGRTLASDAASSGAVPAGFGVVMAGLLLSQFVGNMNATIVTTALPTIMDALGGTTVHYTWTMTATILGLTASTPLWSRLADIRNPKTLMQIGILLFCVGGIGAGFAQTPEMLIAFRALTGIGLGGMVSLVQVIIALLVPPRIRGRYTSWLAAVQLIATVGGPVVGGLLAETPGIGWRACFLFGVPVAVLAAVVLQITLKLGPREGSTRIDVGGALLLAIGTTAVLAWTSLAQGAVDPLPPTSTAMLGIGILAIVAAVVVELRVAAPVLPLRQLARRVPLISLIASVAVGSTMFGGSIFVIQYLQYGRGLEPATSGLLLVSVAAGTAGASFSVAAIASRTGLLKASLVTGTGVLLLANVLLATLDADTPIALVATYLLLDGLGIGATAQYLILAAQNTVGANEVGAISGGIMYFRSLGGTLALSGLGGLLAARLEDLRRAGLTDAAAYTTAVPQVFVISAAVMVVGFVAVILLPRIRLRSSVDVAPRADQDLI